MTSLDYARELATRDHGLAVVAFPRPDGTVGASVVNAAVLPHPATNADIVAFVSSAAAQRLVRLRQGTPITVTFRAGWQWASVEGTAELAGPDDPHPHIPTASLPRVLRDIFTAAGGAHDDWDAYDRAMAAERRVAVLITPHRVYTNPGARHVGRTANSPLRRPHRQPPSRPHRDIDPPEELCST